MSLQVFIEHHMNPDEVTKKSRHLGCVNVPLSSGGIAGDNQVADGGMEGVTISTSSITYVVLLVLSRECMGMGERDDY